MTELLRRYPEDVLHPKNYYGYPKDLWDRFTPEQKTKAATIFALVYPELAISAGAQEILETGKLSLNPEDIRAAIGLE